MTLEKSKSIEVELQTLALAETESESEPKSFVEKIKLVFSNITIEPIVVCYALPSVMASLAIQNLNLEKACRVNLNYDPDICDALTVRNTSSYDKQDEIDVQKLVASMNAWKNVIQSVAPCLLLLFIGSWSDRHNNRKPCIILPIIGEIGATIGFIICTYFFFELPMEFCGLSESVPPSLTGGWFSMMVGVYSFISVLSSVETRTLRIGAVSMFSNVSITIGIALSGILYKQIGFYGVFFLSLAMYFFALIYGFNLMKGTVPKKKIETGKSFLADFFDLKHISETFKVAFKKGERNRKRRICTIMILVMVIIGPMHGKFCFSLPRPLSHSAPMSFKRQLRLTNVQSSCLSSFCLFPLDDLSEIRAQIPQR